MMKGAGGMSGAGAAAMQAAEYNAKIRERNAKIAEQAAEYRERVGEMEVVDFRGQFAKLQARAGTAYRKAGVQAGTGTPLRVLADNANEAAKQVQRIQTTAVAEAGRHREQARHERFAGQLALLSGQQQAAAYRTRGQSDLFGGLGSLLFSSAQFGQAGGFGQIGNIGSWFGP